MRLAQALWCKSIHPFILLQGRGGLEAIPADIGPCTNCQSITGLKPKSCFSYYLMFTETISADKLQTAAESGLSHHLFGQLSTERQKKKQQEQTYKIGHKSVNLRLVLPFEHLKVREYKRKLGTGQKEREKQLKLSATVRRESKKNQEQKPTFNETVSGSRPARV